MLSFKNHLVRQYIFFVLLVIIVIVAYGDAMDGPFVLDDSRVVERSLKLREISNFLDVRGVFSARPLVNLSFAVDYQIAGLNVRIYHATNLLFHIFNTFLVFFLTRQIFSLSLKTNLGDKNSLSARGIGAFLATGLFALHPIQSQAVIYISQRAALMACFFYLLSIIFYIKARQIKKGRINIKSVVYFFSCILFAAMAFLSKKNAASLPLMISMTELMFFTDFNAKWGKKLTVIVLLTCLISICFLWLAGALKGDLSSVIQRIDRLTRETTDVSRWHYLITQFTVILSYMRLIAFPNGLNIDHGYPIKSNFFDGFTPYACLILITILILSIRYARKFKILSFGVFWFFIALSVESSILPIRDAMFEHRVYLAFPGFCIIFGWLMTRILPQKPIAKIWISGIIFVICAIGVHARAQIWENELSLWHDATKKAPHHSRAWNNYGNALVANGNRQLAFYAFRQAIAINPINTDAYCNLGKLYAETGNLEKAEELLLKSIKRSPRFAEAHNNLAVLYMMQHKIEEGIEHFEKTIAFDPERPVAHFNLGKAYLLTGQYDKALKYLQQAIQMKPDIDPMAYYFVGAIWALKNNPQNAARSIATARQKGLDKAFDFVKKDPRFAPCRSDVLKQLNEF